jgi:uncharacterized protein (UPF0332 family)
VADADVFLDKARESLASAEDDFSKQRYNSCARNGYYAAFQAAVAALITEGVRPRRGVWGHDFVQAEFQGRLVYRRKIYSSHFRRVLSDLFRSRAEADYTDRSLSRPDSDRVLVAARDLVIAVEERIDGSS